MNSAYLFFLVMLSLCLSMEPQYGFIEREGLHTETPRSCSLCQGFFSSIKKGLQSDISHAVIKFIVKSFCSFKYAVGFCEVLEENVVQPSADKLLERLFNERIICKRLNLCEYPILQIDNEKDYIHRVLKDKPPVRYPKTDSTSEPLKFVVFADVHVDHFYKAGTEVNCNLPLCCRANYSLIYNKSIEETTVGVSQLAGKYGSIGHCDIPFETVESFVNFTTETIKPDFFLWLGDNSPHNVWSVDEEFHVHSMKVITKWLNDRGYAGIGKAYPVAGNHEGMPCDTFDVYNNTHQWILDNMTDIWKGWFTKESQEMFQKNGCFSQVHPGTSLRLIGIFPLAIDLSNKFLWPNITNPWGLIEWLEEELRKSEENEESVFILNHFSSNTFFMNDQWGLRYRVLIDRYTNIIRGIFSGHTHEDTFQIIKGMRSDDITGIIFVHPALTTYRLANPSFRVYEMDPKTYVLRDYVQYRLYIEEADKTGKPTWVPAYRFSEFYKVPSLDYQHFPKIIERIRNEDAMFKNFTTMMFAEGPRGAKFYSSFGSKEFALCRLTSPDIYEYQKCIGIHYVNIEYFFGYGVYAKFFNQEWIYLQG